MERIDGMIARISKLPERRRAANLRDGLKLFRDSIHEIKSAIEVASAKRDAIRVVFAGEDFPKFNEHVAKIRSTAGRLRKRLEGDISKITSSQSDKDLTTLRDSKRDAVESVDHTWRATLDARIAPYRQLVRVAKQLQIGGAELGTTMDTLEAVLNRPPTSESSGKKCHENLRTLQTSVEKLGLEGPAGDFLIAASKGQGDPRLLQDEQVRSFFEEHDLWNLIVVTTRKA